MAFGLVLITQSGSGTGSVGSVQVFRVDCGGSGLVLAGSKCRVQGSFRELLHMLDFVLLQLHIHTLHWFKIKSRPMPRLLLGMPPGVVFSSGSVGIFTWGGQVGAPFLKHSAASSFRKQLVPSAARQPYLLSWIGAGVVDATTWDFFRKESKKCFGY